MFVVFVVFAVFVVFVVCVVFVVFVVFVVVVVFVAFVAFAAFVAIAGQQLGVARGAWWRRPPAGQRRRGRAHLAAVVWEEDVEEGLYRGVGPASDGAQRRQNLSTVRGGSQRHAPPADSCPAFHRCRSSWSSSPTTMARR